MSTLANFYDQLMPELPGITTDMVDLHLRETAREFCVTTSAWLSPLAAINLVAAQDTYTLVLPTDSVLVRIKKLTLAGVLLWEESHRDSQDYSFPCPKYVRNDPPFLLSNDLTTITLIPDEVPTAALAGGMVITAALKPTESATTLPDFLKSQYSEAMRYGTLARLMMMKKPWVDRPLASEYASRYQKHLNFAAYQAQVGNTRQPLRVKSWG